MQLFNLKGDVLTVFFKTGFITNSLTVSRILVLLLVAEEILDTQMFDQSYEAGIRSLNIYENFRVFLI